MKQIHQSVVFAYASAIGIPGVLAGMARKFPNEVTGEHGANYWFDDDHFGDLLLADVTTQDGGADESISPVGQVNPDAYVEDLRERDKSAKPQRKIARKRKRWKAYFKVLRWLSSVLLWVFAADAAAGIVACSYYGGFERVAKVGAISFGAWIAILLSGLFLLVVYFAIAQKFERMATRIKEKRER